MMKIVIIKYNAGNTFSVQCALERIGCKATITDNPDEIKSADRVIFPGVGAAASAMKYLKDRSLDQVIKSLSQPVLGICIGLQLLCEHSEEGDTDCLGIFPVKVKKFTAHKVPQIGWNAIKNLKSPVFENTLESSYVYFVHSYYAELSEYTIATSDYGLEYSAALQKDNFYAVQFHAEKSADVGQKMLKGFLKTV